VSARVPFLNLRLGDDAAAVQAAIQRVIERGWFVLGPAPSAFAEEFAGAAAAKAPAKALPASAYVRDGVVQVPARAAPDDVTRSE